MGTSDTVRGYYVLEVNCTYKLKWKPLLDSWVLGVLHIYGQEKWAHQTELEVTTYSNYTAHISSKRCLYVCV